MPQTECGSIILLPALAEESLSLLPAAKLLTLVNHKLCLFLLKLIILQSGSTLLTFTSIQWKKPCAPTFLSLVAVAALLPLKVIQLKLVMSFLKCRQVFLGIPSKLLQLHIFLSHPLVAL